MTVFVQFAVAGSRSCRSSASTLHVVHCAGQLLLPSPSSLRCVGRRGASIESGDDAEAVVADRGRLRSRCSCVHAYSSLRWLIEQLVDDGDRDQRAPTIASDDELHGAPPNVSVTPAPCGNTAGAIARGRVARLPALPVVVRADAAERRRRRGRTSCRRRRCRRPSSRARAAAEVRGRVRLGRVVDLAPARRRRCAHITNAEHDEAAADAHADLLRADGCGACLRSAA